MESARSTLEVLVPLVNPLSDKQAAITMSRPEKQLPPDLFYNDTESRKYTSSSRIINIQRDIADRCIELLNLPEGKSAYILDVGCGSGLSGQALEEAGHVWLGCDISPSMLEVAREEQDADSTGDVLRHDMGLGLPFTQVMSAAWGRERAAESEQPRASSRERAAVSVQP